MYVLWITISRNKKKGLVRNKMYVLDVFTPKKGWFMLCLQFFKAIQYCAG